MSVDPVDVGFQALYALLTGDGTFMGYLSGGVWQVSAPKSTAPDYCQLVNQSSVDTLSGNAVRLMTRLLYQVKVMGPIQDAANIRTAYARADALLQPSGLPLRNYASTLAMYRENMLPTDAGVINGVQWYAAGALYRVEVA